MSRQTDEVRSHSGWMTMDERPAVNEVQRFVDDVRRFPGIDPKALAEERFKSWRRRLFGHPLARVFILGDRLAVIHHPGGAA